MAGVRQYSVGWRHLVEERATRPTEKLLWEIPGVEYIYSTARDSESPSSCASRSGPIPTRASCDSRKSCARTSTASRTASALHSARYDHHTLRRLVAEVDDAVKAVPLVAETTIIGGARRQVRVLLDPVRLASRHLSAAGLVPMLQQGNRQFRSGGLTTNNQEVVVETGALLTCAEDVGNVVVGIVGGRPSICAKSPTSWTRGGSVELHLLRPRRGLDFHARIRRPGGTAEISRW